jgi:uncharacterized protein
MRSFTGRRQELSQLQDELDGVRRSGDGAFLWVRGRRRVGKSRLVEEFAERCGASYVFFRAPRRELPEALRRFSAAVAESSLPSAGLFADGAAPESWVAALRLAAQGADRKTPAVIVIDELPYLVESDRGFDADLQEAWDRHLQHLPIVLIAIGSDISTMDALTDHGHALHGRPTRELMVRPFSPAEVAELLALEPAAAFDAYMVVGGFPSLATTWRKSWDRRSFLEHALADSYGQFVVNGERILGGELGEHPQARQVLEAIGAGERTFSAIRDASGVFNAASLNNVLKLLGAKGIVAEASPYAAPPAKKSKRYSIADPYLRFWLRFVGPSIDEIDRGRSDLAIARIEAAWSAYRGKAIEPLVQRAVERLLPDRRFGAARYVGGYWTRSNDVEVALIGADLPDPRSVAFVGSVKWRERARFGAADVRRLARLQVAVPGAEDALLVGVSRSGFAADAGLDVALTPADLLAAWSSPTSPGRPDS